MRLSIATSVLACASAHAFSDSSPFILLSTAESRSPPDSSAARQLQTSSQVLASAGAVLDSCPTERYLLVSQPNVHASDLRCAAGSIACQKAPVLKQAAASYSVLSIAEVVGKSLTFGDFAAHIEAACLSRGVQAQVSEHTLKGLPPPSKGGSLRDAVLAENDRQLRGIFDAARAEGDFTAVYFSNPNEPLRYEAEFVEPMRMDLRKRQSADSLLAIRAADNSTDHRGLFQKYQFFTPGVFMAFFALFIMLSILYVGLSALGSLEVSYGAFEKEMGPTAQKKNG